MHSMKIGFLQRPAEIGGPGSFLMRLERGLKQMGHEVVFLSEPLSRIPDVILVLGGPIKALLQLIRWKKKGCLSCIVWPDFIGVIELRQCLKRHI